ncbi:MAG: type II toxin-antitoxin system Phd/YefM family antitoxin [Acidobacteria bacterium]|nr:type II toxin-antitoxin system Phd/YefM family antitoxin [Acidobacteriota bacterium]
MGNWKVQDAKAKFSELVEKTLEEGPQVITRRGVEAVVMVPAEQWKWMKATARPTLKEILLTPYPKFDNLDKLIQPRGRFRRRKTVEFE